MKYPKELKNLLRRLTRKRKRKLSENQFLKLLDEIGYYVVILGKTFEYSNNKDYDRVLDGIAVSVERGDIIIRILGTKYKSILQQFHYGNTGPIISSLLGCEMNSEYCIVNTTYNFTEKSKLIKTKLALAVVNRIVYETL